MEWILNNLANLVAVLTAAVLLAEAVARLTPTEKDNSVIQKIKDWLDRILPNLSNGGGTFKSESKRKQK